MNLIALETATDACSVALLRGESVVADLALHRPRAHAENLILLVRDALAYGGITASELDAVAVSMGPGSYTGLRIGVSAAKGLAVALDLKLVGVPTLEALAASVAPVAYPGDLVCTLLNARRDEVYATVFSVAQDKTVAPLSETAALPVADLPGWLNVSEPYTLWLAGDGAGKAEASLRNAYGDAVRVLDPDTFPPSAGWVARLALPRLQQGKAADVAAFEPFYLKDFVAKKSNLSAFERLPF
jgi:tRNA threonylcarbamoyladenosine biosynthesis protein TsaB